MFSLFTHPLETLTLLEPPPGFHKGGGNHVCAFTSPPLVTPTRPVPFKAGAASADRRVKEEKLFFVHIHTLSISQHIRHHIRLTGDGQSGLEVRGHHNLLDVAVQLLRNLSGVAFG